MPDPVQRLSKTRETMRQLEDRLQRSTDKIETTQAEGFRQVQPASTR